jgi:hypothetical protein
VAGCCENSNDVSGPIKRGRFVNELRKCWILKMESAA